MRAYERLLKYVQMDTESSEESGTHPSTASQFELGKLLVQELKNIGAEKVRMDDKCYVYAEIPATSGFEKAPKIGVIAHMDTAPDFSGKNVHPRLIENYDGNDVVLGDSGRVITKKDFPHLSTLKGRTLIVTDGNSLLGADDKAGVSEIMTMAERLITEKIPHGKILIAFTPDEEIGEGADFFDVENFGADFAYTVDGGPEGYLEFENFNAAAAKVTIHGVNVHPGSAKNIMINASLIAMEFNSLLPAADVPSKTEDYEGFFHLCDMEGNVEKASLYYIIRDHSNERFEGRKELIQHVAKVLNEKYPAGTVELELKEQYRNMISQIEPCMHLIETAKEAALKAGANPVIEPIRGGTDGARLSFMGLPCPNLGTGGYAFHGPFEHITVEGMDTQVEILLNIVDAYKDR